MKLKATTGCRLEDKCQKQVRGSEIVPVHPSDGRRSLVPLLEKVSVDRDPFALLCLGPFGTNIEQRQLGGEYSEPNVTGTAGWMIYVDRLCGQRSNEIPPGRSHKVGEQNRTHLVADELEEVEIRVTYSAAAAKRPIIEAKDRFEVLRQRLVAACSAFMSAMASATRPN